MEDRRPAVHRTIFVVDVEGFGDKRRTNQDRLSVRDGMYRAVQQAFRSASVPWADCYHESCGDGVFVLIPAEVPKGLFVESVPRELAEALQAHNAAHSAGERIRMRVALHAGEVYYDEHGVTAESINLAFRLLDARPLKSALADSPGVLALIVSPWFFDEVVRHSPASEAATYRPVQVAVKETSAVGWISRPDHPYPPDEQKLERVPAAAAPVPQQLPAHAPHFVGRGDELNRLTQLLDAAAPDGETAAILAIDGTAGVGKTTLALRWAHQVAPRFGDGQLYVNLRGHDPSGAPMAAAEAIREFLDTLGVPADRVPAGAEAQARLYRSLLAGRRMLVMLDNARDVEQVRPILPGPGGCLTLITSRRRLADLEEAVPLTLETLPSDQAAQLFTGLAPVSSAEPEAVDGLVRRCGCLPLAIRLLAGRLRHHPSWTVADLVAAVEESEDELEEFHAGSVSAAAAFDLSYRDLPDGQQRLFRSLGLHPGPDVDARAAAAMIGAGLAPARRLLDALYDNHLIEETARGRYAMHDLLRAYARALAAGDAAADRDAATARLLDYYLRAARAADRYLSPQAGAPAPDGDQPGGPDVVPDFPTRDRALAWMRAERLNLQACVEQAAATARYPEAIAIAEAMSAFLYDEGYWDQARSVYQTAAAAGKAAGDQPGVAAALANLGASQARALNYRGSVQYVIGDYRAAADTLSQALQLLRGLSDPAGHAEVLLRLAAVQLDTGDYPAAGATLAQALPIYRDLGDQAGQAATLSHIGTVALQSGDYPAAAGALAGALAIYRDLGDGMGEATVLGDMSAVAAATGDHQAASTSLTEALALARRLRYRLGEANALSYLGALQFAAGDYPSAASALTQALGIFGEIGDTRGQARALGSLGAVQCASGDYPVAGTSLTQALGLCRETGDRAGQAGTLNHLGTLHLACAERAEALGSFTGALAIARELTIPRQEASALAGIGRCLAASGDTPGAADHLSQALAIYQRLGAPEAAGVTAELAGLHADGVS
ncbi:MAG TPA: tetratricopeptide repeat protein [Streptosporangiaceae bacterium]|nr:tetratricopeptide repeat protein [Streptosporangiaceae bacterium]